MAINFSLYDHIIKINPKYAVSYLKPHYPPEYRRIIPSQRKKGDKFTLSKQARKSMNNCFTWLRIISNKKKVYSKKEKKCFWFELSFITLTLPAVQTHSDEYIKAHLLSPFLKWMQRSWDCNSYIWKAEVQNNGNIHFHITTNKFMHWKSIRTKWNRLCMAHGYCKVYQDGSNDKGDAATSVKAVINAQSIQNYVACYCTKKDTFKKVKAHKSNVSQYVANNTCIINNHYYLKDNYRQIECSDGTIREYKRNINGRLWNASYNLNVESAWLNQTHEPYSEMNKLLSDTSICKPLVSDYSEVYIFKAPIFKKLPADVKRVFKEARSELRKRDVVQKQVVIESFK